LVGREKTGPAGKKTYILKSSSGGFKSTWKEKWERSISKQKRRGSVKCMIKNTKAPWASGAAGRGSGKGIETLDSGVRAKVCEIVTRGDNSDGKEKWRGGKIGVSPLNCRSNGSKWETPSEGKEAH